MESRVFITSYAYAQLVRVCRAAWPHEACGVLSAPRAPHHESIGPTDGVHPVPNASDRPEARFAFEAESWIETFYRITNNRQMIAGFYHSHPNGSPLPSGSDAAGWPGLPGAAYWIVSFSVRDRAQVKAYLPRQDASGALVFTQVSVQIT
ncbi:hypothetical protein BG53_04675 [Paenibacillus darwinianus]|uniref:JAB domain-containing protein n=1 Tax=Paenibacillus darwinianus TaxID=1380763 RepID=A0A9W5S0F4_9BACL|nr:Mov34/MPN/PAD-1 family protein [Paenibacillus darwinianus]EXX86981.1 hypothetical protein CH50_06150 [Paenibacillus darwinianus]EXX87191.1 hypothetical protein BG53_04675 [Paenibacillus darwinianus]EXX87215.1 hypothetical protein BG52_04660 [Paenibacillus darwinianus]